MRHERPQADSLDACDVIPRSPVSPPVRCRRSGVPPILLALRRERFDVLIIGGGVTGVGAALDAASRGLSVALVEARDLAAGTSSRSSKLIHGGLRYLEQFEFGLVHEALHERGLLTTRLAPHLVRPVPILVPLTTVPASGVVETGAGARPACVAAFLPRLRRRAVRRVRGPGRRRPGHAAAPASDKTSARRLFPSLREDILTGAIRYYDGQVDDARYVATMARTAASLGAPS